MADPVSEDYAMRRAAFEARLRDEQRRERDRAALGATGEPAPLPVCDAIRPADGQTGPVAPALHSGWR